MEILWGSCGVTVVLTAAKNNWQVIKEHLARVLPEEAYQNWVSRTELVHETEDCLEVAVPDEYSRIWLERELAPAVDQARRQLGLSDIRIRYVLNSPPDSATLEPAYNGASPSNREGFAFPDTGSQLNPRFTFDTFVVGSCNQFAHAAACAVARQPATRYNPLFIYGNSGMGKTHLLHAVGRALLDHHPGMRVVYTTGEQFMNEMIQCLRAGRMLSFQHHYRKADALLIDDIHILGGKERTQEEFFHTFNSLYDHQKQIVISSDQLPKNIPGLVERLRTRFECGLIVDVQPPDLETKMAILDKKAEAENLRLPDDVRILLATRIRSSVRELEGALTKLIAYSSVTGAPITAAMALQALRHMLHTSERRVTIDSVIRAVADRTGLQPAQLRQKTNAHEISRPRQIAMYLCRELTAASLPEIGRHFGGKHHTTVLHAIRKVEELRRTDPEINRLIQSIIDSFQ
ncbi:MAG: chromosomal replication initiation protein DnaA [Bryobacteraceae bacterium]|nr:MAG: chromosomal replication initiation protein DnaA [Bryobacteraceae bacterium]